CVDYGPSSHGEDEELPVGAVPSQWQQGPTHDLRINNRTYARPTAPNFRVQEHEIRNDEMVRRTSWRSDRCALLRLPPASSRTRANRYRGDARAREVRSNFPGSNEKRTTCTSWQRAAPVSWNSLPALQRSHPRRLDAPHCNGDGHARLRQFRFHENRVHPLANAPSSAAPARHFVRARDTRLHIQFRQAPASRERQERRK